MPYISKTIHCSDVDSNGCVTPALANPFNGDLIFECSSNCTIKVCDPDFHIHGTLTVGTNCHVIFTGNLTVIGTVTGEPEIEGSYSLEPDN